MVNGRALAAFRERFRGQVVVPGDPGYDRARAVWNATADARPAVVARCGGVEDVVAAVRFARERGCWSPCAGAGTAIPASRPATGAS